MTPDGMRPAGPGHEWLRRLRLPVIAAPMFLLSGPDLVIAAARAGIVGAFPTLNARTPEILRAWLARITRELAAGEGRPGLPWAANVIAHSSNRRLDPDVDLLVEHRPPMVISALGSPRRIVERVHGYGGLVVADVNSIAFARKAADTGVDGLLLVASGAGGHTGDISAFAFVETVRTFWRGTLILSGGISTGRAVRAATELGADLVSMGTRFICSRESLAVAEYKRMVIASGVEDIIRTDAFTGAWANMLRPSIVRAGLDPDRLQPKGRLDVTDDPAGEHTAWRDIWSAGHGVGTIQCEQSVAEIVEDLARDFERSPTATPEETRR
jgi:nitronate monooxygenase